ncbi:hypothetical protein EDC94DRAFT_292344 [Helicostylum pulchrum]|nr:hypothetical protein EDC94DRAFT_292344 [Helicostylum pulchrum]
MYLEQIKRNIKNTSFYKEYQEYWYSRDSTESQERIAKRHRRAAKSSNEVACYAFEATINKVAEASSSVVGSATVNEVSGDDGASSSSTDHVSRDTNEKAIEDLKDHTFHKLREKFIFLDKDLKDINNEIVQVVAGLTKLPNKSLSNACRSLINELCSYT